MSYHYLKWLSLWNFIDQYRGVLPINSDLNYDKSLCAWDIFCIFPNSNIYILFVIDVDNTKAFAAKYGLPCVPGLEPHEADNFCANYLLFIYQSKYVISLYVDALSKEERLCLSLLLICLLFAPYCWHREDLSWLQEGHWWNSRRLELLQLRRRFVLFKEEICFIWYSCNALRKCGFVLIDLLGGDFRISCLFC